jgi:hypothetical protein
MCARTAVTGDRRCSAAAMTVFARSRPADAGRCRKPGGRCRCARRVGAGHDRLIAMHLEKELRSARVVRELRPVS